MKRQRLLFAAAASLAALVACAEDHTDGEVERRRVLLVLKARDNPFFQQIEAGVRAGLRESDSTAELVVRSGATEADVSAQRRVLDEFHQQYVAHTTPPGIAAVLLTPSGSKDELTAQIKAYKDHGVKIILVDTRIDSSALARAETSYDAFVGSNNAEGGALAGRTIVARLPRGGRILLLNGSQGHETAAARRDGFQSVLDSVGRNGPKYLLVQRTANWRRSEARSTVDALLALGQQFDAIFAANDEMALGAAEALRQRDLRSNVPFVLGFDAIDEARTAVREGRIAGTIAQQPFEMGRLAVLRALRDTGQRGDVVVPVQLIAKP